MRESIQFHREQGIFDHKLRHLVTCELPLEALPVLTRFLPDPVSRLPGPSTRHSHRAHGTKRGGGRNHGAPSGSSDEHWPGSELRGFGVEGWREQEEEHLGESLRDAVWGASAVVEAAASAGVGALGGSGCEEVCELQEAGAGNASEELASGGGDGGGNGLKGYGGGGDGESEDEGKGGAKNRDEALMALSGLGKTLENLPADLASAIQEGRITGAIVKKYFDLKDSKFLGWLLSFAGFKERLLADDLFMTKVGIECGVGIFTKTAAELEKRKEKFSKELDFVIADVVMALIADFMLVWLPAPTVSLRPRLTAGAGGLAKFFYNCPDNAFQVAFSGQSFSLMQRIGAIVRNGSKLLAVGTTASLVGTASTNALIAVRRKLDKNFEGEVEDIPILQTSLAYGVYMAISSNLRYQILAGVVEQRILEPMLHKQKLLLSIMSFAVRTGNTFLGSLMWVDYARWVGVQKDRGTEVASAIEGAAAAIEDAASSAGVAPA